MMITILVAAFLTLSAICTTVLIAACVVAKRSEEVIDSTSLFIQYDTPAEPPVRPAIANPDQKPAPISTAPSFGKAMSS